MCIRDRTWTQQALLALPVRHKDMEFGRSCEISNDGDVIAISAKTSHEGHGSGNTFTRTNHGAVYMFERSGTEWTLKKQLFASDAETTDLIGYEPTSVALTGDGTNLLAGAEREDTGGTSAGAVYAFQTERE